MDDDKWMERIVKWAVSCSILLNQILPLHRPIATHGLLSVKQREALLALSAACFRTSSATLTLIKSGYPWDAEITLRSVTEGTYKYIYLLSEPAAFDGRFEEYSSLLPNNELLKQHRKAKSVFDIVVEPEARKRLTAISTFILSDDEVAEIQGLLPSNMRAIEQRWGVTGLVLAIEKSNLPFASRMKALLSNYSSASNLAHVDMIGAIVPWDQEGLRDEINHELKMAESARIIADIYVMAHMRVWTELLFVESSAEPLARAWELFEPLYSELEAVLNETNSKMTDWRARSWRMSDRTV